MKTYRNHDFSARILTELLVDHEPAILTLGRMRVPAMYVLPIKDWREQAMTYYGEDAEPKAKRLFAWPGDGGMTERSIIGALSDQVGTDKTPCGLCILTLGGEDAAYLVPHNTYWKSIIDESTAELIESIRAAASQE